MDPSSIAAAATTIAIFCGQAGILCNNVLIRTLSIHRILVSWRFEIVAVQVSLQLIEELLIEDDTLAESVKKNERWDRCFDTVLRACDLTLSVVTEELLRALETLPDGATEHSLNERITPGLTAELQGQRGALRTLIQTLRLKSITDVMQVLDKEQDTITEIGVISKHHTQSAEAWRSRLTDAYSVLDVKYRNKSFAFDKEVQSSNPYRTNGKTQQETPIDTIVAFPTIENAGIHDTGEGPRSQHAHESGNVNSDRNSQIIPVNLQVFRELDRNTSYGQENQREMSVSTRSQESVAGPATSLGPTMSELNTNALFKDYNVTKAGAISSHTGAATAESRETMTNISHREVTNNQQDQRLGENGLVTSPPDSTLSSMLQVLQDPWSHYAPTIEPARLQVIKDSAPLHYAAFVGDSQAMRELLYTSDASIKNKINANVLFDGDPPIIYAARAGHIAAVEALLAAKANVALYDNSGKSAHHWALICSHEEIFRLLIGHDMVQDAITLHTKINNKVHTSDVWNCMSLAAYYGNASIFQAVCSSQYLYHAPLHWDSMNTKRRPLQAAVSSLPYLLFSSTVSEPTAYESWCRSRYSPFWLCNFSKAHMPFPQLWCEHEVVRSTKGTLNDRISIITCLLAKGFEISKVDPYGYTALQAACCGASMEIVEELLDRGATRELYSRIVANPKPPNSEPLHPEPSKSSRRLFGSRRPILKNPKTPKIPNYAMYASPLHLAALWGRSSIIEVLIRNGASPDTTGYGRTTPLHFAAAMGNVQAIETLLLNHAAVDAGSCSGLRCTSHQAMCGESVYTPLSRAVMRSHLEAMVALIKGGADMTKQMYDIIGAMLSKSDGTRFKETILHQAVRLKSSIHAVEMLLNHGADANLFNDQVNTSLHVAIRVRNKLPTIQLLLSRGADPNLQDSHGKSALHFAIESGSSAGDLYDLIKALLDAGANSGLLRNGEYTAIDLCTQVISRIKEGNQPAEWSAHHNIKDYVAVAQMLRPYRAVTTSDSLLASTAVPG